MKAKIISAIIGWIGGIGGALIFEPIDGILDILLSDFSIGGIIIGILGSILGSKASTLGGKIGFNVVLGLVVFLVFGLLSSNLGVDLIAGAIIGILVALAGHFFADDVERLVDKADNLIDKNKS